MGILLLFIITMFWGLVGTLVKTSSFMVDSWVISFSRFFFGIIFLGILMLVKDRKIGFEYRMKWIWIGAGAKCVNYILENIALSMGHAYENILVALFQTLFLVAISIVFLKERPGTKKAIAAVLCLSGALLISWNGLPLAAFFESGLVTKVLFIISAFGSAVHFVSQKKLVDSMDAGKMNFSVFLICSVITAVPLPFGNHATGPVNFFGAASLVLLGLITGVSFYLYSLALKKVTFFYATIINNSSVIFALIWSKLLFNDPITGYIIIGVALFMAGVVIMNLPAGITRTEDQSAHTQAS